MVRLNAPFPILVSSDDAREDGSAAEERHKSLRSQPPVARYDFIPAMGDYRLFLGRPQIVTRGETEIYLKGAATTTKRPHKLYKILTWPNERTARARVLFSVCPINNTQATLPVLNLTVWICCWDRSRRRPYYEKHILVILRGFQ